MVAEKGASQAMQEPLTDAEVKVFATELVRSLRVMRMSTLIRFLESRLGEKSRGAWSVYVSRLVRQTEIEFVQRGGSRAESVLGVDVTRQMPVVEVQAAHELRVADLAVEFIRAGFDWTPPLARGSQDEKVSDGTAWLGDVRIEVEVELSAKTALRWRRIIGRYRDIQARESMGVLYVFSHDGLRRSFRTVLAERGTPGWWYLGVSDTSSTERRQEADAHLASLAYEAIQAGEVGASNVGQAALLEPTSAAVEKPPQATLSRAEQKRQELLAARAAKEAP